MLDQFHLKLIFVMKALSFTRADIAMKLRVDKSLVGRWVTGKTAPSGHNLARLTALVATRVPQFTMLDWERPLVDIGPLLGTTYVLAGGKMMLGDQGAARLGPLAALTDDIVATTARRASAYEGFFRNTRALFDLPGKFLYDYVLTRKEGEKLISYSKCIGNIFVESEYITLNSKLFIIGVETSNRLPVFGIINGVNGAVAESYEGLILYAAHDPVHTPVAQPFISERVGDLSGDRDADDARFAQLGAQAGLAPEGAVPARVQARLLRDVGPLAFANGGEMLMSLTPSMAMSRARVPDLQPAAVVDQPALADNVTVLRPKR